MPSQPNDFLASHPHEHPTIYKRSQPYPLVHDEERDILSGVIRAGSTFNNAKDTEALWETLLNIRHPQPPTFITTDNTCAEGI